MQFLKQAFSSTQIKALLRKDFLVRRRQPWMTVVQFVWPCIVFLMLYSVRFKFEPKDVAECQYPTRQLPTKNNILPFFHSYICSIENKCMDTEEYEEYSRYENAPLKPVIDIAQIIISEDAMFNAIVNLPIKGDFMSTVLALATNSRFNEITKNIEKVVEMLPAVEKMIADGGFDIKKLFSDRKTFVKGGKIICGHPFPSTDVIRLVEDILASEDFSDVNDAELEVMPTPYCKQLYRDVTSSNNGKITWSQIKPIIHGKILYGPDSEAARSVMKYANTTFLELDRLKKLSAALDAVIVKARTDEAFQGKIDQLLSLAKLPVVKTLLGDSVDVGQIEALINGLKYDATVADVVGTIKNILECFSVDRFVPVQTEEELLESAFDFNQKRLYYGGLFFDELDGKDVTYRFHMDTDNTPVTFENRNRFWFPGPEDSMIEDLKYHRGFVQIKHAIDMGIIRHKKSQQPRDEPAATTPNPVSKVDKSSDDYDWFTDWDEDNNATDANSTDSGIADILDTLKEGSGGITSGIFEGFSAADNENDTADIFDSQEEKEPKTRRKRAPQFDGLFGFIFGGGSSKQESNEKFEIDEIRVYTKQFPYPAYVKDDFKKGLYLAQAIQMAFFVGLMAQVATAIRHRVWMKESRNTMLMRAMGLKPSSEITAWSITTMIELVLIFIASFIILAAGGILQHTGFVFLLIFLLIFGLCLISFCYMCSTFFASATTGPVSSVILFLMSFLPYIIIVYYDAKLVGFWKFVTNLSFTTAFCYAWDNIMRIELQGYSLTFGDAFSEGMDSEFTYAFCMIVLDIFVYAGIGYFVERVKNDEFTFHEINREKLDPGTGAVLENVSKVYMNNTPVVSDISLKLPKDQVTCLLGRNGAGKSTIIKMLTGQVVPTTGKITMTQNLDNWYCDKIGLCSQDNILIPNMTAREHLTLYAKIKLKREYDMEVLKILSSLNFGKYENYEAHKLSGGYQRRLCVAIAFLGSPNVVILDEPCNGVDSKARKCIWELVKVLRKDRAVVLATHYLDEAEFLSDSVIIMNNGKIIAQHNPETMKSLFLQNFELNIESKDNEIIEAIRTKLDEYFASYRIIESTNCNLRICASYDQAVNNSAEFLQYLEALKQDGRVHDMELTSKNLEEIFHNLNQGTEIAGQNQREPMSEVDLKKQIYIELMGDDPLPKSVMIRSLLWKRLLHFKRNYRLLLSMLILPAVFQILAMAVMQLRIGGEFDTILNLTRTLYPDSTRFFSMENPSNFTNDVYGRLRSECPTTPLQVDCMEFDNSTDVFRWILNTTNDFQMARYGGLTFNETLVNVWYNNKGYHSMMAWLSDLNSHMLQAEMDDAGYSIATLNQPYRLGVREISTSSLLQQVSDAGAALIILVAFSLVIAGTSVFIVNERVNGEKLQQKLCGVGFKTYWGVAILWDFLIFLIAVCFWIVILKAFNLPVFVDRCNLAGIFLLIALCGFAAIPGVHVFEKLFSESSFAIMTIFCMNMFIAVVTISTIVLFDVLGETDSAAAWRHFLNRVFLVFPQHALADGLIEIVKNYIVAESFKRFDIDSYKSPLTSDLLSAHFLVLICFGGLFMAINYAIESGQVTRLVQLANRKHVPVSDLKIVSIQSSLKREDKDTFRDSYALSVDSVYKNYNRKEFAVKGVSFEVGVGQCFGLLGKNGAGKSTIFKMLSGEISPTFGTIDYFEREVSYCPQTSAVDSLLTVEEVLAFYGVLRRVSDIPKLIDSTLKSFHLGSYRKVLVKNLSGGNRRKLNVAVACMGRSSVVLMDEPTSDMDPVTRALVYKAIHQLLAERRAVVLTSHTISEIEPICGKIAVLKEGRVISLGSPELLKATYGGYYSVTVFCDAASNREELEKEIRKEFKLSSEVQQHTHTLKFLVRIQDIHLMNGNNRHSSSSTASTNHAFNTSVPLSELFRQLNAFSAAHSIQFTLNRCRLDTVFEKILDTSDNEGGYTHSAYVHTETTNT